MQFIQGQLREQTYFTTLEDQVAVAKSGEIDHLKPV